MATILVVEDNPDNQKLIKFLLEREGHQVLMADHAEAAREHVTAQLPNLILMDIQIPGTDGLTLTAEFQANPATRHIPVIALTANAMSGDREKIMAVCHGYIPKPINTRTLASELATFLA